MPMGSLPAWTPLPPERTLHEGIRLSSQGSHVLTSDSAAADARNSRVHMCRADEKSIEEEVKRNSASEATAGAKTLCIPLEQPDLPPGTKCFKTGKPAKNWALWGRSY